MIEFPHAAADAWAEQLAMWSLPDHVVTRAPESPWKFDVGRFAVDDTLDRHSTSARWAREILPPTGGTVLDIGCGGGRAAMSLVPPANEVIGVDASGAMLDAFVDAASSAGVARRTVHGTWPDVAPTTPPADVVVCHHVVYNVPEIVPFVLALTMRARLGVVVELPVEHPMSAWSEGLHHFWGIERPEGPRLADFVAVLRELGLDPEFVTGPRSPLSHAGADPERFMATARRRLCLSSDRDDELTAWLADHPPRFVDEVATVRWPGAIDDEQMPTVVG